MDDMLRPTNCECDPSGVALSMGSTVAREYTADGDPVDRIHEFPRQLPLVLRGYWLGVGFDGRDAGGASAATWLRCGKNVVAGQAVYLRTYQYRRDATSQEFLVFFPRPPEADRLRAPVCEMHIALNDTGGRSLKHYVQRVLVASAIQTRRSADGKHIPWAYIPDILPRYDSVDPPPPDPPARLCHTTAEK